MPVSEINLPVELQPVLTRPLASVAQSLAETLDPDSVHASQDGVSTPTRGLNGTSLPPVDSGPAFVFLAAATVLE